jgi:two-component sensor histidine kinase
MRPSEQSADLLLHEANHRCANDLQLVISLLALQSRRATTPEARQALADVKDRVMILARARSDMTRDRPRSLEAALRQVCEALQVQADSLGIVISVKAAQEVNGLSSDQITTLALVVNELITNALKHAFDEGKPGYVKVLINKISGRELSVIVDDDGLPLPELKPGGDGLGFGLVRRLMASINGLFIMPPAGTKAFELRVPVSDD